MTKLSINKELIKELKLFEELSYQPTKNLEDTILGDAKAFNQHTNKHRQKIHELIESEVNYKQKLRREGYITMKKMVICQFIFSISFTMIYIAINT